MFLRSKVQETILKGRSRSMNGASAQQRISHVSDQLARASSTVSRDSGNAVSVSASGGGSKSALFAPPRPSHSSSLPTGGSVFGQSPAPDADSSEPAAFSTSPTSVLDAAAPFASGSKRRPWREGPHGLADALDYRTDWQRQGRERSVPAATSRSPLVRSCSLDRRVVEFGVKSKGSWPPLRKALAAAAALSSEHGDAEVTMEPSSEDYTCVICRGPNPKTVHIFGDRVVEDGDIHTIRANFVATVPRLSL